MAKVGFDHPHSISSHLSCLFACHLRASRCSSRQPLSQSVGCIEQRSRSLFSLLTPFYMASCQSALCHDVRVTVVTLFFVVVVLCPRPNAKATVWTSLSPTWSVQQPKRSFKSGPGVIPELLTSCCVVLTLLSTYVFSQWAVFESDVWTLCVFMIWNWLPPT